VTGCPPRRILLLIEGEIETMDTRVIGIVVGFGVVFISGFVLRNLGYPRHTLLLTAHKLIALAALLVIGMIVYQSHQAASLTGLEIAVVAVTAVLFIGTIVIGGFVSLENEVAPIFYTLHLILPFLTVLASAGTLVMMLQRAAA
jgi:hypothetical protein